MSLQLLLISDVVTLVKLDCLIRGSSLKSMGSIEHHVSEHDFIEDKKKNKRIFHVTIVRNFSRALYTIALHMKHEKTMKCDWKG